MSLTDLKRTVLSFRVSELQALLAAFGHSKFGLKSHLQAQALNLLKTSNPAVAKKINELQKSVQVEVMSYNNRSGQVGANNPHLHANKVSQMQLSSMSYQQQSNQQRGYSGIGNPSGLPIPYTQVGTQPIPSYPINPDVKFKKLPFYDLLADLLKPSSLAPQGTGRYQEAGFTFSLTPQQANKIANSRDLRPGKQDYTVQVQMRFCLLETSCDQEDTFPPNIAVKINDKMCPLPSPIPTNKPGVEPKRPPRPVNITALCRISPTVTNRIMVSWASEYGRCYVIAVYLVQKLSSDDLLHRLKSKGVRIPDFTRSLIKQKLNEDADCEIATTSLRCSLTCPLGKMRMLLPCRANTCSHLQCFDASLYLQMNERKPTWTCPVCDKPAIYDTLVIDGYFQEVLRENDTKVTEVTLGKDGGWTPLLPQKEKPEPVAEKKKNVVAVETLSDSDDDSPSAPTQVKVPDDSVVEVSMVDDNSSSAPAKKGSEPECITLESSSEEESSSDEEEDDENENPAKRQKVDPLEGAHPPPPTSEPAIASIDNQAKNCDALGGAFVATSQRDSDPIDVTDGLNMGTATNNGTNGLPPQVAEVAASIPASITASLPAATSVTPTQAAPQSDAGETNNKKRKRDRSATQRKL